MTQVIKRLAESLLRRGKVQQVGQRGRKCRSAAQPGMWSQTGHNGHFGLANFKVLGGRQAFDTLAYRCKYLSINHIVGRLLEDYLIRGRLTAWHVR